ncbi:MAG: cysteine--tRNA ligase [Acidimicrobiales bacterium]
MASTDSFPGDSDPGDSDPARRVRPLMRLYDTARRQVVPFNPGPTVTIYTCGITPYDATHVGHAATYALYDVLQRRLRDLGHRTQCVRNVTDVDDDLLARSAAIGIDYQDLAKTETARFDDDMVALGMLASFSEPAATSAIHDILGFVGMVLDRGHAYESGGAVYFSVSSFDAFGQVSHLERDEMLRLAAERGGNPADPAKRDPLDFILWQPSLPGEPWWPSMWGPGRPGWHIECSALALRELGTTIDLHGGGSDLIFPHHECEAAQSEAATGQPFVRHWLHAPMVNYAGTKMSKSLGNLVFVSDLRRDTDPMAVRLALLDHSYRQPWEWTDEVLQAAVDRLDRWRRSAESAGSAQAGAGSAEAVAPGWPSPDEALGTVRRALDDDLNLPAAVAALDRAAAGGADVSSGAALLGITLTRG